MVKNTGYHKREATRVKYSLRTGSTSPIDGEHNTSSIYEKSPANLTTICNSKSTIKVRGLLTIA
jgi:hypothetical protein